MNPLVSGNAPGRLGNGHPNIVPYQACAAAAGHILLAVGNDGQFRRFCVVAGRPELAADERFATNAGRVCNRNQLVPILREIMKKRSSSEWIETLEER